MLTRRRIATIGLLALIALLAACRSGGGPSARYGAEMVYDAAGERVILFGGRAGALLGERVHNDLWAYEHSTQKWSRLRASPRPPARLNPGLAYDPVRRQLILFGGLSQPSRLGDTWVYDIIANRWEEAAATPSPSARSDGGFVYDAVQDGVILTGGYCLDALRGQCRDTWRFDPATRTWHELAPDRSPPIIYGPSMDYDPVRAGPLLFGGHMSSIEGGRFASMGYSDAVWRYDAEGNSWQEVASARRPQPRYWHQATVDTTRGRLVLFGGDGGRGFLADTWVFDLAQDSWQQVNTERAPPARANGAMAYDAAHDVTILFGGQNDSSDRDEQGDTWVFEYQDRGGEWRQIVP